MKREIEMQYHNNNNMTTKQPLATERVPWQQNVYECFCTSTGNHKTSLKNVFSR